LKKPKKTKKEPRTLSREQLQEILHRLQEKHQASKNKLYRLGYKNMIRAYLMMCETAMRGGEVWSLEQNEIDLTNRHIYHRKYQELAALQEIEKSKETIEDRQTALM
jgi:integrase